VLDGFFQLVFWLQILLEDFKPPASLRWQNEQLLFEQQPFLRLPFSNNLFQWLPNYSKIIMMLYIIRLENGSLKNGCCSNNSCSFCHLSEAGGLKSSGRIDGLLIVR
jgi:hypothetical protein